MSYTVTGTISDGRTVILDEALPLKDARVRVTLDAEERHPRKSYEQVLGEIRARQEARGHVPRPWSEIEAQIREERDAWD
jgi:hypothetical protein